MRYAVVVRERHLGGVLEGLQQGISPVIIAQGVVRLALGLALDGVGQVLLDFVLAGLEDPVDFGTADPAHDVGVRLVGEDLALGVGQRRIGEGADLVLDVALIIGSLARLGLALEHLVVAAHYHRDLADQRGKRRLIGFVDRFCTSLAIQIGLGISLYFLPGLCQTGEEARQQKEYCA